MFLSQVVLSPAFLSMREKFRSNARAMLAKPGADRSLYWIQFLKTSWMSLTIRAEVLYLRSDNKTHDNK